MKTLFCDVDAVTGPLLRDAGIDQQQCTHKSVQECDESMLEDCEVLSVFVHSHVTKDILEKMPKLRLIALRSTGFDNVDVVYCKERHITVCNVPSYGENTVAEYVFAMLLQVARNLPRCGTPCALDPKEYTPGFDLAGKTMAIIGTGHIGQHVARIALGFGMHVVAFDVRENEGLQKGGVRYMALQDALSCADIVTLHTPLLPSTVHMFGKKEFDAMKQEVIFINTARGALVDSGALQINLQNRKILYALLDVCEDEWIEKIVSYPQVLYTPHVAYNTVEATKRIIHSTIENMKNFEIGKVLNTVSGT